VSAETIEAIEAVSSVTVLSSVVWEMKPTLVLMNSARTLMSSLAVKATELEVEKY